MGQDPKSIIRIALALLLPFVACGVQWLFWSTFRPFVWFLFFPTAFFSSRLGGKNAGLVSTVISALLVVYFFIPPQLSFLGKNPANLYSVAVFLFMGMLFSFTHERLERANRRVQEALEASRIADERKLAEEEIRQLNASLEQRVEERTAELLAANHELDAFAYAVSHDLRAPLRAMGGFSQALVEDFGDRLEGEARDYLEEIIIASRHMGQLIDGLLTLSRSTRGELCRDRVELTEMADRIRGELEQAEPHRRVEWRIEPGLSTRGDVPMIEVVMRNLLGNAWKYTTERADALIRVHAELEGNDRFFCVADNGAGFDMAHAEKLFQPFQRLHRQDEFPGIGIGLATAQRIVHRHGGKIRATGAPHQGATFSFSLPLGEER